MHKTIVMVLVVADADADVDVEAVGKAVLEQDLMTACHRSYFLNLVIAVL